MFCLGLMQQVAIPAVTKDSVGYIDEKEISFIEGYGKYSDLQLSPPPPPPPPTTQKKQTKKATSYKLIVGWWSQNLTFRKLPIHAIH